jgi:hypothetical protein
MAVRRSELPSFRGWANAEIVLQTDAKIGGVPLAVHYLRVP